MERLGFSYEKMSVLQVETVLKICFPSIVKLIKSPPYKAKVKKLFMKSSPSHRNRWANPALKRISQRVGTLYISIEMFAK